jgi:hypothetical protein
VVFAAELEDALGGDHVLESVLTEVTQVAVDERRRRPRNEHLSSMARGSNASSAVDVDADVPSSERRGVPVCRRLARCGTRRLVDLCPLVTSACLPNNQTMGREGIRISSRSGVLARVNYRLLTSRPSTPSRRSPSARLQAFLSGPCRDRTYDLGIKSPLLYQLS